MSWKQVRIVLLAATLVGIMAVLVMALLTPAPEKPKVNDRPAEPNLENQEN
ncbi:MAG: hypothetical protein QNJ68_08985 [Microcoleaceae cyanobacterium MO_207.B10]|nr:hypothetical protein [Microcoleaceae cyanobacterium MO_207.B10]